MKILYSILTLLSLIVLSASAATESEVLDFLKEKTPGVHQELLRLKQEEPGVFAETYPETANAVAEYQRVLAYDPAAAEAYLKMFVIDFNVVAYADQIAKSSDVNEVEKLRAKVKEGIGKSFDQWVIYERARLRHLQSQLELTIKNFEADAANKESVVEYDTEALIEESRSYLKKK